LSLADLEKWDARYRSGHYAARRHPTALLEQLVNELPRGSALDVACGAGRNALFLARSGFDVDAVDISGAGLKRLRADAAAEGFAIRDFEADLEHCSLESLPLKDCYDLIVMVRYVNQPLIEPLIERLADGGVFLSEQHLATDLDVVGPRSESYRLAPNALLDAARGLRVHFYREGIVTDPDGRRAALAQIVASRGGARLFGA
jgi:tellurite methyltransferase